MMTSGSCDVPKTSQDVRVTKKPFCISCVAVVASRLPLPSIMLSVANPFNSLSHISKASSWKELEPSACSLLDLALAESAQLDVSVVLLHKHFDLSGDEKVVASFDFTKSEVHIEVEKDPQDVVPYMWQWNGSQNEWVPIQFAKDPTGKIAAKNTRIFSSPGLLASFATFLEQNNLTEKLGLGATFYDLLSVDLNSSTENIIFAERTNEDERRQLMKVENEEEMLGVPFGITHWWKDPNNLPRTCGCCCYTSGGSGMGFHYHIDRH